uniref:Toll-like receptor 8 n=2 Tax=Lepisosteus oculatus TaxID=7918 RepID=W5M5E0_LEPOC|nr:PREDICTED: toll-like receptor 8 [Lepisosteus oculatus]
MSSGGDCWGTAMLWGFLVLWVAPVVEGEEACECPKATILQTFPSAVSSGACCLNYSGSSFGSVKWSLFSQLQALKILDLSSCNITEIQDVAASDGLLLRELFLNHNRITLLPERFLANASNLRAVHLEDNRLDRLPDHFLRASDDLEELYLDFIRPSALALGLLKPSLQKLELGNNSLDCSCALIETLQGYSKPQGVNVTDWSRVLENLTCASPENLNGKRVWMVHSTEVCRSHRLTALFVLLPLALVLVLLFCWCCGRKRKRKEGTFKPAKHANHLSTVDRNGSDWMLDRYHHYKPCEVPLPSEGEKNVLLKNQLMLRPSTALLGSSRDLYEEVEIRLGSVDSLVPPISDITNMASSMDSQEIRQPLEDGKPDVETVSVSEVLKDSADREKLYLTQSTEYYNLVPGIDLEDSDHGEYENVDLS